MQRSFPRKIFFVVLALSGALAETPTSASAAELVLLDAKLVDPTARSIESASLLLRDGRVAARGVPDGSDLKSSGEATRVDLAGAWLVPTLVDLRVHAGRNRSPGHRDLLGSEGTARVLAGAGITLYADPLVEEGALAWRARPEAGPTLRARSRIAGPVITCVGGRGEDLPGARLVRDAETARDAVEGLAASQADLITVIFDHRPPRRGLPLVALQAVLEASERRALPCVVEVGSWDDVRVALGAGAKILCHLPTERAPAEALDAVRAARPAWIPTLAVALDFRALLQDEELRADPLLARCAAEALVQDYGAVRVPKSRFREGREMAERLRETVASLDAAGVRWLTGSDSGAVGTFHGWSLHRELRHLQEFGVRGWSLLAAATTAPADLFGERRGFGPGDRADFVVCSASPVDDVRSLAAPSALVLGGEWVDPAALLGAVLRTVEEESIPDPLHGMGRSSLLVAVLLVFAVLLLARRYVKRAAAGS